MRPMIWKELRENFKWAVLWMLGMGLAMAYALSSPGYYWSGSESICSQSFLLITTIGCALGAGLLGFLQVIMEMRRDQWAFLVHRPVTRNSIFAGKVVAGMMLYLAATGIPLLVAAWWASTPGKIAAPFDGRMILPGFADILCGVVFYFAGMLTGLRQARWYASRALGVAVAVICAALVTYVTEFWQALIPIVLIGTIMGLSAWGSFLTAGSYPSQPKIAKASLGVILIVGIGIAGSFGVGLVSSIFMSRVQTSWTQYQIDKNGEILRVTADFITIENITDVHGNPIAKYSDEKYQYYDAFSQNLLRGPMIHSGRAMSRPSYRNIARYFASLDSGGGAVWHYVSSFGKILGYSMKTKRLIGLLGPEGFALLEEAHSDRFEGRLRGDYWYNVKPLYAFDHRVYEIELMTREVKEVFAAAKGDLISRAFRFNVRPSAGGEGESFIAVATGRRIHMLTADADLLFAVAFHYDLQRHGNVSLLMMPEGDRFFVWYRPSWNVPFAERLKIPEYVVELSGDGSVLNKHELPPLPFPVGFPWYAQATSVLLPVGALVVLGGHALLSPWLGEFGNHHFFEAMASQGISAVTFCTLVLLSGVFCAALASYITRCYGFAKRRSIAWSIFSFFVGPGGILAFLALLDWPALEECSSCGKKRVVDREQCSHCNASCPSRVMDGTEIFET